MAKKVISKYWCDNNCGRNVVKETSEFPSNEGWIELKFLEVGDSKMENKDFCSRNCMFEYISKAMMTVDVSGLEPKPKGELPPIPREILERYGMNQPQPQNLPGTQYYEEIVDKPPVAPPQPPKKRGLLW